MTGYTNNLLSVDMDHILAHTQRIWDEVRGEQIFITGGTGFFGRWLLESFVFINDRQKLGAKAVVLSRNPEHFAQKAPHLAYHPAVSMLQGDVRDFDFPAGNFRFVIHAATESSAKLNRESPLLMFDTIVDGTRRVLEFARIHGTKSFLLTSSGAIYGKQPLEITHVPEDFLGAQDPMDQNAAYGIGKRAAEHLCCLYAQQYSLEVKIARCFAFVGPFLPLDIHFAIGNFIRDALQGGPIRVNGDGTPSRSYQYAADLAIWLWTILFRGQACRPYNVGSDQEITIADVAKQVRDVLLPGGEICVAISSLPGQRASRYVPSIARIRDDLGCINRVDLPEAIRRTAKWAQKSVGK